MIPKYDLDKIKFSVNHSTFEKAIGLYDGGKIKNFVDIHDGFNATVIGTKPYNVFVSAKNIDRGDCECYLGQTDVLCKHMVAVAIYAVTHGKPLGLEDRKVISEAVCSGILGELSKEDLAKVKKEIFEAIKYIKSYSGPSRTWFAYQDSLSEGCRRLSTIISDLPVSEQTAKLLVVTLLRLDKKLCNGGVDDSDGAVGGFIGDVVSALIEYAKLDHSCTKTFQELADKETCFGWEEPLVKLIKNSN